MRFVAGLTFLISFAVYGQTYPAKPIHVLVPFAPGGAVDTTARVLAQAMQQRVNWQFVIENRPGGNGFIATTAVKGAAPDGYTLLMAHTGEFAVNPALFDNVPYELERDFMPITMVSDSPMLYLANVNAPFNNFKELVAQAKANPGKISFSSAGNGSINHLAGEWLAQAAGIQLLHVPYKGGAPAAAAVAAGDRRSHQPGGARHAGAARGEAEVHRQRRRRGDRHDPRRVPDAHQSRRGTLQTGGAESRRQTRISSRSWSSRCGSVLTKAPYAWGSSHSHAPRPITAIPAATNSRPNSARGK